MVSMWGCCVQLVSAPHRQTRSGKELQVTWAWQDYGVSNLKIVKLKWKKIIKRKSKAKQIYDSSLEIYFDALRKCRILKYEMCMCAQILPCWDVSGVLLPAVLTLSSGHGICGFLSNTKCLWHWSFGYSVWCSRNSLLSYYVDRNFRTHLSIW